MTKKTFLLSLLGLLLMTTGTLAQQTAIYREPEAIYRQAMDLFNKEKYGAAKQLFLQTADQVNDPGDQLHANASLFAAICAAELFNADAEHLLKTFLHRHPGHFGQRMAWFHLGNVLYRQRDYEGAVAWYGRLRPGDVDMDRRTEFVFKKGYSHFMTESYATAAQLFSQISDPASPYYGPASYYHGHVAYLTGDYETAMSRFTRLTDDRHFGPVVPYYIVHIYYLREQYDALLEQAPALLETATPLRAPEIARIIGEAHLQKNQYEQAVPYLQDHISRSRRGTGREDHYQLGFALYMSGRFEEAIPHLERATGSEDEMGQNAYFHLASAYIETDRKRFARNAFMQAYQHSFSEELARESLFNYALLSLELSYDPHNEAILSFQRYIREYPGSPRTEEAFTYLVDLYMTTRNYKDALASLNEIPLNTPRLREAHQRVSYFRGVELFNNGDFQAAEEHFRLSMQHPESRQLAASALFWIGEAHYRRGQYDEAIAAHERFLVTPGAFSLPFFNQANYSIGYAHFKKRDHQKAIPPFRRFIAAPDQDPRVVNDAILRIADSYFISKEYPNALEYYNRAIRMNVIDTDYAIFQTGLVQGITGRYEQKIATLEGLLRNHPRSSFIDDSRYEIANTWLLLNNNVRALHYFDQLIRQHPNSPYTQSAKLKTGLIHYNENEDEQALAIFRDVAREYPGTSQAEEALAAMRIIHVNLDRVDEFVRFTEKLGVADITQAQEDSLVYQAAESRYMRGECDNAVQSFNNYLDRFPSGIFTVNAHFYRSECLFRANEHRQALQGYLYVIQRPRSKFLENALLRASGIQFSMGSYTEALALFTQLEEVAAVRNNLLVARLGKMRCYHQLERYQQALDAAGQVLEMDKLSQDEEQEAHLVKGLSALMLQDTGLASSSLGRVIRIAENRRAAEAMYHLALISFRAGDYQQTEEQVFDYINKLAPYEYWLARIFILLADVYIETGNFFQATHTLESIIENYEGEEMREEARKRLAFIAEQEEEREQEHADDGIEIDLEENN